MRMVKMTGLVRFIGYGDLWGFALRSHNVVLVLKYGESNAMGSALNTWQMPQTAR